MARARTVTGITRDRGLILALAGLLVATLPAGWSPLLDRAAAQEQTTGRPLRPRVALSAAIECHRRGEYEQAALFLQQAQAGVVELTDAERQDLATYQQRNNSALAARREGADQVRQAEQALHDGQMQKANDILKKLALNRDYLTSADKMQANQLFDRVHASGIGAAPQGAPASSAVLARTELQHARTLLNKGSFDAADKLALEVEGFHLSYAPSEDSPAKLRDDIARARTDSKFLLTAARAAFERNELDRAEQLANQAEKYDSYRYTFWGDTPSKVRKDVANARARGGMNVAGANKAPTGSDNQPAANPTASGVQLTAATPTTGPTTPAQPPSAPALRSKEDLAALDLMKQARQALDSGDLVRAEHLTNQARAFHVQWQWYDEPYNPDVVQGAIERARVAQQAKPATPAAPVTPTASAKTAVAAQTPVETPEALLKQARDAFNTGKLDDATRLAQRAKLAGPSVRWGIFADTPDKVLKDVDKAHKQHDLEESERLLVEGRKRFELKDYDGAQKLAYRSGALHGPYAMWDLGDNSQKLLADIDKARAKERQIVVPPVPPSNVVRHDDAKTPDAPKVAGTAAAPTVQSTGGFDRVAQNSSGQPNPPVMPPPDKREPLVPQPGAGPALPPATGPAAVTTQVGVNFSLPPATGQPPVSATTQAVQQLVAEGRRLQKEGRLLEARQKLLEAQQLLQQAQRTGSVLTLLDSPADALIQLNQVAYQRHVSLQADAEEIIRSGTADLARFQKAEETLARARQLAVDFRFDLTPIDTKIAWVRQLRTGQPATAVAAQPPPPGASPEGLRLLEAARVELRSGQTSTARRMTEEAYRGNYGVRDEAEALLRNIDQEDFNQRCLEQAHSFDAGLVAYRNRDYAAANKILASVDAHLLDADRQHKLNDIMTTPEMQRIVHVSASEQPAAAPRPDAGIARATDGPPVPPEETFMKQTQVLQVLTFQKLRADSNKVQAEALTRFQAGDTEQAIEMLREFNVRLSQEKLAPDQIALLRRPIDDRLQKFQTLKAQMDFEQERNQVASSGHEVHHLKERAQYDRDKKIADLLSQYEKLFLDHKYAEAQQKAQLALDLDPDNVAAIAAGRMAQIQIRIQKIDQIKKDNADDWNRGMDDVFDGPHGLDNKHNVRIDKEVLDMNKGRSIFPPAGLAIGTKTAQEKEIEYRLMQPMNIKFVDTPLDKVLDDLHTYQGINIWLDKEALKDAGISPTQPITMQPLENVSLRDVLDLMLGQLHLTHVTKNGVLFITTEANSSNKLVQKVYQVADLIIPVRDSAAGGGDGGITSLPQTMQPVPHNSGLGSGPAPYIGPHGLTGGSSVGAPGGAVTGQQGTTISKRFATDTIEEALINLITNTVKPESWSQAGGRGTIDYYPLGMALVINQTPDIQEQVADLLAALRRLQDLEVAVEVRFISIAEGFFERIGVNFSMDIQNNQSKFQPQLVSGQFQPAGFIQNFSPNGLLSGLTPAGTLTNDLSIPISTNSFAAATPPPFGGFSGAIPNGGLDVGLAFLSEIQVFLFLEAVQGDQRTNVMQAPKLMMFNGQTATLTVMNTQFFVTGTNVVPINGQIVVEPNVTQIQTGGVNLTIQPVVSADRRFVRMSLSPTLTNLASAVVPLFPVVTPILPFFDGGITPPLQPVLFTQFLQQPVISTINVSTTVVVPDGGTVLLGGLKRLSEGRNESGPPVLSKIPYIDRLFRNVGYSREAESLLLMVTPRIIITEEEEERATGVVRRLEAGASQ